MDDYNTYAETNEMGSLFNYESYYKVLIGPLKTEFAEGMLKPFFEVFSANGMKLAKDVLFTEPKFVFERRKVMFEFDNGIRGFIRFSPNDMEVIEIQIRNDEISESYEAVLIRAFIDFRTVFAKMNGGCNIYAEVHRKRLRKKSLFGDKYQIDHYKWDDVIYGQNL